MNERLFGVDSIIKLLITMYAAPFNLYEKSQE